ncbi:hypothetical protein KJ784_03645, partial [Patescibacteria group bacterium]|nr:hypothetical protein [Patescibacteria group bacterium]
YWLHGEFVLIDGERMGKSLGNFVTLAKVSEKFNPLSFRYLTLTAHYRSQLNLTWESLAAAQSALNNLYQKMRDLTEEANQFWPLIKLSCVFGLSNQKTAVALKTAVQYAEKFRGFINDDLNTPEALSLIWKIMDDATLPAAAKKELLLKFDKVFGLDLNKIKPDYLPRRVKKLAQEREIARQQKQWDKADQLRAQIIKEGWLVEDTPRGPKLMKNIK